MSPFLVALVFLYLACAAAFFALPKGGDAGIIARIFIIWAGVTTFGFLIPSQAFGLTATAIVLFAAAPPGPVEEPAQRDQAVGPRPAHAQREASLRFPRDDRAMGRVASLLADRRQVQHAERT